ncbi:MAG: hypothetical protein JJ900_01110 [Rhodospirillales bacterium]|nr:hypothetical protein [Rhodospirillales bacterium]MBO6785418.1 hypothetical protein [Rhodospirillales bacterium]
MAAAKKKSSKRKTDTRSTPDKLVDAALEMAAEMPWHTLSLPMIAAHAKVPVGEALLTLPSRTHIQRALIDRIDTGVFKSLEDDPLDGTTKDMLFDVLMRRFDALDGHQAAIRSMSRDAARDPFGTACLGARFLKSMALSLQAAGVSAEGCKGRLRAKALAVIQMNATRVWITDDDPGLARTMAALDKGLARAEKLASGPRPSGNAAPEAQ